MESAISLLPGNEIVDDLASLQRDHLRLLPRNDMTGELDLIARHDHRRGLSHDARARPQQPTSKRLKALGNRFQEGPLGLDPPPPSPARAALAAEVSGVAVELLAKDVFLLLAVPLRLAAGLGALPAFQLQPLGENR